MGNSLNIRNIPPPPILVRRSSAVCRSNDTNLGVSITDGRWRVCSLRFGLESGGLEGNGGKGGELNLFKCHLKGREGFGFPSFIGDCEVVASGVPRDLLPLFGVGEEHFPC